MGATKQYDPRQNIATWNNINLSEGIAEGTFITVVRNEPTKSLNVGGDGGGTMVTGNNRSGLITVTLRAGSITNALLSDVIIEQEKTEGANTVVPFFLKDFSGNDEIDAPEVFLVSPPEFEKGTEEANVDWVFEGLQVTINLRGSLDAGA